MKATRSNQGRSYCDGQYVDIVLLGTVRID